MSGSSAGQPDADTRLVSGHLEIDLEARSARARGSLLSLTAKEFDLLAFFAVRPGHVFSREQLLVLVWQSSADWQQIATVTEHVHRLRSKIEEDPDHPQLLVTVRGRGYRFDAPRRAQPKPAGPLTGALVHVNGRIVSADEAAVELLMATSERDLVGLHVLELVAPGSVAAATERLLAGTEGAPLRSQLMSLRRLDGEHIPVEIASSASTWNERLARHATITDVSRDAARLSQLVTGVFIEVSDAVIIADTRLHIRSWNDAASRLYGWDEHEVLGRHLLDIVPWDTVDTDLADAPADAAGRWHGQRRQKTRDGIAVVVDSSTTVVRDDDGVAIGEIFVNRVVGPAVGPASLAGDDREVSSGGKQ